MDSPRVVFAVGFLLAPVLYVVSYLALVVPQGHIVQRAGSLSYEGEYRIAGKGLSPRIFWPLERIDRQLRPEAWEWLDIGGPGSISGFSSDCCFMAEADVELEYDWFGDMELMEVPPEGEGPIAIP